MADLDLNHLIAASHGGVTAERVSDAEVVGRLRALESQPQFARGVDLAAIRDKQYRQHRWVTFVTFSVEEPVVEAMFNQRKEIAGFLAEEIDVPDMDPVMIPMGGDNMVETQGPGCMKCQVLWEAPENGFGTMCSVDDRQFGQQKAMLQEQQNNERSNEMQRLVGIEKGKLA